jgi:hypothetical protein
MKLVPIIFESIIFLIILTQIILPVLFPSSLSYFWILKKGKFWLWQTKKIHDATKSLSEEVDGVLDELKTAHKKADDLDKKVDLELKRTNVLKKKLKK